MPGWAVEALGRLTGSIAASASMMAAQDVDAALVSTFSAVNGTATLAVVIVGMVSVALTAVLSVGTEMVGIVLLGITSTGTLVLTFSPEGLGIGTAFAWSSVGPSVSLPAPASSGSATDRRSWQPAIINDIAL